MNRFLICVFVFQVSSQEFKQFIFPPVVNFSSDFKTANDEPEIQESSAAYSLPSIQIEKKLNDPGRPYPMGARPFPVEYPPQIPTDPYLPQQPPPSPQPIPELPIPAPQQPYFPQIQLTTPPSPAGPKQPYEINYCDKTEFPDSTLAQYALERIDYFIYNKSCSGTFYQCSIGQTFLFDCLSKEQAFDPSIVNCNYRYDNRICPEYDHILHCSIKETCTENQFACCASPQKCIDLSQVCNGVADCADEEDEHNCPSCAKDEFACVKSGRCIPATLRCNGQLDDCQDSSNLDEIGCSKNTTCWGKFICNSPQTMATLGRSECIDYELHCNGVKECPGGEDEEFCRQTGAKYLLCENQKQSVLKEQWCDGQEHCADGSDERYCY